MSNSGRGESKTLSTASNAQPSKKKDKKGNSNDKPSNVSLDLDVSFDLPAKNLQDLQQMFQQKLIILQAETQGKIDSLYNVIKMKDEMIGKLQADIGALKKSFDFISKETSENHNLITECSKTIESKFVDTNKYIQDIKDKTVDLEDRSRRSNLVFFNFPERDNEQPGDCERLVHNVLNELNILQDEEVWIDRAHRLGRKKPDSSKPRPVIVKFSYFKHKEEIIKNASRFRNSPINVSEDFSKETLDIRKKLISYGKNAKSSYDDPVKSLIHYKLNYRRLLITYSMNKKDPNARKITRSFSLGDISGNVYWFMLKPEGRHVAEARGQGYQSGDS